MVTEFRGKKTWLWKVLSNSAGCQESRSGWDIWVVVFVISSSYRIFIAVVTNPLQMKCKLNKY